MLSITRSLMAAQRDASQRVAESRRFSIRLPVIGTVRVPPPDQLAFYGVLGGLAVLELIDWPVALAMGLGSAVIARHMSELEEREEAHFAAEKPVAIAAPAPAPVKKAPAKKAPAKKAPVKKAPVKKAAAKKAPAKKVVKKAPAKKAPAKRTRS